MASSSTPAGPAGPSSSSGQQGRPASLPAILQLISCPATGGALPVDVLEGIHALNGLLLAATSFPQAQELAQQVMAAAAAACAGPPPQQHVVATLTQVAARCDPASVLALHCLISLAALSHEAREAMAAHGAVATLVGQLLGAGASLEPALRLGSLRLLQLLAAGAPGRVLRGARCGPLLRVVAGALQPGWPAACGLGLQVLQEVACTRQVLGSPPMQSAVLPALEAVVAHAGAPPPLRAHAQRLLKLLRCLPTVLGPE